MSPTAPFFDRKPLFRAGEGPYAIYRIPGIITAPGGALIAYCEARRNLHGDWGATDILLRSSRDGGCTWDVPVQMNRLSESIAKNPVALAQSLAPAGEIVCGSPVAIADSRRGIVHFLYCVENYRCFYRRSVDDGRSWSDPMEITSAFDELQVCYPWRVFALGPGHGIQLSTGRLLVPVWLSPGSGAHAHRPSVVATIYSDDSGAHWQAGEILAAHGAEIVNPSEAALVELANGRVMANIRSESAFHCRLVSTSPDGASQWSAPEIDGTLFEPVCFASLVNWPGAGLLFVNPDSRDSFNPGQAWGRRENLTVRLSRDEGRTWPLARVIDSGPAGYADLAIGAGGAAFCFYEGGSQGDNAFASQYLWLARFNLEWLEGAKP